MKKTTLFIAAAVFFLVSSCIPSLHSIVDEENRVVDDRLVGDWLLEEDVFLDMKFNFSVTSDDKADETVGIEMMKEFAKGFTPKSKKKSSHWKIERAMNFKAKDEEAMTHPKGHGLSISFNNGGALSMLPKNRKWTIVEKEELPFYILTYKVGKDKKRLMRVELTKIGTDYYLDFYPYYTDSENRFSANSIYAHTFAKVIFTNDKLTLNHFNIIEIEKLIKSKKLRLKHEILDETTVKNGEADYTDNMVLTASTQELRAFISKYSDNENLFDEAEELTRYNEKTP